MREDLSHLDVDHEPRRLAVDRAERAQLGVAGQPRAAVHAQRLGDPRDDEEQPDAGPLDEVLHAVETPVAGELRHAAGASRRARARTPGGPPLGDASDEPSAPPSPARETATMPMNAVARSSSVGVSLVIVRGSGSPTTARKSATLVTSKLPVAAMEQGYSAGTRSRINRAASPARRGTRARLRRPWGVSRTSRHRRASPCARKSAPLPAECGTASLQPHPRVRRLGNGNAHHQAQPRPRRP